MTAVASLLVVAMAAGACSTSADTTQVEANELSTGEKVPTTSIVRSRSSAPSTTTTPVSRASGSTPAGDPQAALAGLLGQLAGAPELVAQLEGLDAIGVANLLGIDLSALSQLGLTAPQVTQLARSVAGSPPAVRQSLAAGTADPTVLLGLLAGSLDLESLANGTLATVVQSLLGSIAGLRVVVSPQLSIDLGELLNEIDPNGLGPLAADPANASLLALITSAFIGANPLLTKQLLDNPVLDPSLRNLLGQLQQLNLSIGDTARLALLAALYELIPALAPKG